MIEIDIGANLMAAIITIGMFWVVNNIIRVFTLIPEPPREQRERKDQPPLAVPSSPTAYSSPKAILLTPERVAESVPEQEYLPQSLRKPPRPQGGFGTSAGPGASGQEGPTDIYQTHRSSQGDIGTQG